MAVGRLLAAQSPAGGGNKTGPNPTDRAKTGTKRHILTEGGGVPIAITITAANTPDKAALAALLDAHVVRPAPFTLQHLCLDKGYDYAADYAPTGALIGAGLVGIRAAS